MTNLPNRFFRAAFVFFAVGIGLGVAMGATHDFTLKGVHVHVNLLGWVSFFMYGAFYRLFPSVAQTKLALSHYWSAVVGLPPMLVGLGLMFSGYETVGVPMMLAGQALTVISVVLVLIVGFKATSAAAAPAEAPASPAL
jgi:hypothetical protein